MLVARARSKRDEDQGRETLAVGCGTHEQAHERTHEQAHERTHDESLVRQGN